MIYTLNLLVKLLRLNVKYEGSCREESRTVHSMRGDPVLAASSWKFLMLEPVEVDGHPQYLVDDCSYEELRILVPLNIVLVLRGFQMFRYFNHAQKKGF